MSKSALQQAFAHRRVLVTGDTGFKGSWLAAALEALGAEVWGYAKAPDGPEELARWSALGRTVTHRDGDVRDARALSDWMQEAAPDVVFHLAAQPLVRAAYADPKTTFDVNVGGAVNLLEAVLQTRSVRALVFVTSDKCYRNREWPWRYRETDELGGRDPYGASKAAAEIVFASYAESFFAGRASFGAATVRAGNLIGGGDWNANRLVPDCVRALRRQEPLVLRNPQASRGWLHVLDALGGYLVLAANLLASPASFGGAWNFGPAEGDDRAVIALARGVVHEWGSGRIEVQHDPHAPREAERLAIASDKARLLLGWRPRWSFDRALHETIAWYRAFDEGRDVEALTRAQVERYFDQSLG